MTTRKSPKQIQITLKQATKSASSEPSKELISKVESDAYNTATGLSIKALESLVLEASNAYYNTDTPILSDDAFDIIIDVLKQREPDSPVLDRIGATVPADAPNKVKLPYHLGSMDKVKPGSRELATWLGKYPGPYVISEKLDGLSGLLIIQVAADGKTLEMKLYRRGDDDISQEVSHLVSLVNIIPSIRHKQVIEYIRKQNPDKGVLAVRGELIIKKSTFQAKYSTKYPKARSFINGIALSKPEAFNNQAIRTMARDIDYVVYSVLDPQPMTQVDQFAVLDKLGFLTAHNEVFKGLDADILQETLLEFKRESHYEIDGIIVADESRMYPLPTSGNPKHAVAFKMRLAEQTATTTVEYVEYNVSKTKLLKPRVKFAPVKIGGDTIMYATGFNAKFIKDNKLGPGAVITIVKSGDVIPYIAEVTKPAPKGWQEPEVAYAWNPSGIDAYPTDLSSVPEYLNRELLQFFETMDVAGVKAGTVDKLIDAGFTTINDILNVKAENLISVEGFQIKSAEKLVSNIKTAILDKVHPLAIVMNASNKFSGFGQRKLDALIAGLADNQRVLTGKPREITLDEITQLEGFQAKTAQAFLTALPVFRTWLAEHPQIRVSVDSLADIEATGPKLTVSPGLAAYLKQNIVFTGFRDESMEAKVVAAGGKIQSGISGTTQLVVAADLSKGSSKLDKAREKGISVISKAEFAAKIAKLE
jgi:DNA ligase (NAD+)